MVAKEYALSFHNEWPLAVIATTPRSGTWYNHYLFGTYNSLLLGQALKHVPTHNFDVLQGLQLNISIAHANCPGFEPSAELFPLRGVRGNPYAWGDLYFEANPDWFSLGKRADTRYVFINRNPLDHCVSMHVHLSAHSEPDKRALVAGQSIDEFLLNSTVPIYIYRYLSFREMARRFPDRIRIVSYESMMADRTGTFRAMLDFFGRPPHNLDFVDIAIDSVLPEKLKEHERRSGKSLEGQEGQSHIRSGKTGTWISLISDEARRKARSEFLRWSIDFDALVFGTGEKDLVHNEELRESHLESPV